MGRLRTAILSLLPPLFAACSDCGPYLKSARKLADQGDGAGARAQLAAAPEACRTTEEFKELDSRLAVPDPGTAAVLVKEAVALLGAGDEAGARQKLERAGRLDPQNPDVLYLLAHSADVKQSLSLTRAAEAHLDRCEAARAKAGLEEALRLWPGNREAQEALSVWDQPRLDEATVREKQAKVLLSTAQEKEAKEEIARACRLAPETQLAAFLLDQIEMDPKEFFLKKAYPLSAKSFPYTVQSGDSLSEIAKKYLKDENVFYALARYNGMKNPSDLASGQVIQVPGDKPIDRTPPKVWAKPAGGNYKKRLQVQLLAEDDVDPRPKIWYTADGTEPAPGQGTLYAKPLEIVSTTTLRCLAVDASGNASEVRQESYSVTNSDDCKKINFYKQAVDAWSKQDPEATILLCDRALSCKQGGHRATTLRVEAVDAFVNLCRVELQKGHCSAAVDECDRALKHDPGNPEALELRRRAVNCKSR